LFSYYFRFFVLFSLGSIKCGVGGGRWAPYDSYFSYPAKILEKGFPTWPDNRGSTESISLLLLCNML